MRVLSSLVLAAFALGCAHSDRKSDGPDYSGYVPHRCGVYRKTPAGHRVCDHPLGSVAAGFLTNANVDQAIDHGFALFEAKFPEFAGTDTAIVLHDDWIFRAGPIPETGVWAAGYTPGPGAYFVVVAVWSKGVPNPVVPKAWIVRPPGVYFGERTTQTHFTRAPILPAVAHELLHVAIGDPGHKDPRWKRLE